MEKRVGNVRWRIAALLGVGIVINYFDRVNLSVATTPLIKEFHFTNGEIGILLSSYLWSYTLLQIPIGALLDRIGIKWIMRIGTDVPSWSLTPLGQWQTQRETQDQSMKRLY